MSGTLTSAWICHDFSKRHTCGSVLELMPWAFHLFTLDLCLLFWLEWLSSSRLQSWGGSLCVQQYRRTLRNIDSKEICSLLADVSLVLGINKLVNSQEMGLGIYHYSFIHIPEARFSVSHQSWSPWNDANRYQLRPWPKDCEKPQIYCFPRNRKHKCYVVMEVVS